jgi:hypothetical protein
MSLISSLSQVFRTLSSGIVIAKNHYSAEGVQREQLTSFNKGKDEVAVFTQPPTPTDGWSLVVRGTDKSGKHHLTKEIYVDPNVWANTSVGDTYTR